MKTDATPEANRHHQWLTQLVGDWTVETSMEAEPGEPPMKSTGRESVRAVGKVWIVCENHGAMPGSDEAGEMIITLGYDDDKKALVGTWIGPMMDMMWHYRGTLDAASNALTLLSEGPGWTDDVGRSTYRDIVTMKNADERETASEVLLGDGSWHRFMTAAYRRQP
jgi:Protein of unknown function (DUF1579)